MVGELRQTLLARRGAVPVRVRLVGGRGERRYALDDYPVTVTTTLLS